MSKFEKNEIQPFLFQLCDGVNNGADYFVRISDICAVKKVLSHPKDSSDTNGFPKYQVFLKNSEWTWVLVTIEDFNKFIKPFVINLNIV